MCLDCFFSFHFSVSETSEYTPFPHLVDVLHNITTRKPLWNKYAKNAADTGRYGNSWSTYAEDVQNHFENGIFNQSIKSVYYINYILKNVEF